MTSSDPVREHLLRTGAAEDVLLVYDESKSELVRIERESKERDDGKLNKNRYALAAVGTFATGLILYVAAQIGGIVFGGGGS